MDAGNPFFVLHCIVCGRHDALDLGIKHLARIFLQHFHYFLGSRADDYHRGDRSHRWPFVLRAQTCSESYGTKP